MSRLGILLTRSLAPAALCAVALAACGSQHASSASSTPQATTASGSTTQTLYIYSGLPYNGPHAADTRQIQQGIEFALNQPGIHHVVRSGGVTYQIGYRPLSDSTPQRGSQSVTQKKKAVVRSTGWNPAATVSSAERAARNPATVAYIGDLDSAATELSLPILNQAGIVQLTPGSGYPGLTDNIHGVTRLGEPNRYYPQGRPTLLRLIPNDVVEAAAIVSWLKQYPSCRTLAAAPFGGSPVSTEATALVAAIAKTAKLYGLGFVSAEPPGEDTKTYQSYAHDLAAVKGVNCFVMTGSVTHAAVTFTNDLNAQLPAGSVIVGTSGFCNPAWTDQARGGVSARVAPSLYCTTPVIPLEHYLNGKAFRKKYLRSQHRAPTAYTYYGFLAGSLVLKAIGDIGNQDSRYQVMFNLVHNGASTDLETYTFDLDGDLSNTAANYYGLDRVDPHGIPKYYKLLVPRNWLPSVS